MGNVSRAIGPILIFSAGAGLLTACRPAAPPADPAPSVPVAMATLATLENDLVLTAEFRPYQEVDVRSLATWRKSAWILETVYIAIPFLQRLRSRKLKMM